MMRRKWQFTTLGGLLLAVGFLVSCAGDDVPDGAMALVTVGDHVISDETLRRFEEALPDYAKSSAPDPQARRKYLQSLVDRHIMGLEIKRRGLQDLEAINEDLQRQLRAKLIQDVLRDSVDGRIEISGAELREYFESHDVGWQVIPAHILLPTKVDAEETVRVLRDGGDFAALAREKSLAPDAEDGGSLGRFYDPGDIAPPVRQVAFELQPGEVSDPIQTPDGYEVVTILQKQRQTFDHVRAGVLRQVRRQKWQVLMDEFFTRLQLRWDVHYHGERAQDVVDGFREGPLSSPQSDAVLVSYRGGELTVADLLAMRSRLSSQPTDSSAVFRILNTAVLRDRLLLLQAHEEGRDRHPDAVAWQQETHETLCLDHLYEAEVESMVSVEEDETRRHYEQNLDTYTSLPGAIQLTEVLVESQKEAQQVRDAALAGESLAVLAHRYSRRDLLANVGGHSFGDSGHVDIESLYESPYREVLGDSNHADLGKIMGPIRVQGHFSVFRLDAAIDLAPIPYAQIRPSIHRQLLKGKQARRFESYISSLRDRYATQISWFEGNLDRAGVSR